MLGVEKWEKCACDNLLSLVRFHATQSVMKTNLSCRKVLLFLVYELSVHY